jgi:hypothetical protein
LFLWNPAAPLIGNRSDGTLLTIEELFCAHRQSESITIWQQPKEAPGSLDFSV